MKKYREKSSFICLTVSFAEFETLAIILNLICILTLAFFFHCSNLLYSRFKLFFLFSSLSVFTSINSIIILFCFVRAFVRQNTNEETRNRTIFIKDLFEFPFLPFLFLILLFSLFFFFPHSTSHFVRPRSFSYSFCLSFSFFLLTLLPFLLNHSSLFLVPSSFHSSSSLFGCSLASLFLSFFPLSPTPIYLLSVFVPPLIFFFLCSSFPLPLHFLSIVFPIPFILHVSLLFLNYFLTRSRSLVRIYFLFPLHGVFFPSSFILSLSPFSYSPPLPSHGDFLLR